MSQTYVAALSSLLVVLFPMIGVKVGSDELTAAIQTIVVIGAQIWIAVRRYSQGDINLAGVKN